MKGCESLRKCLDIYESLKSYCRNAQRSCDKAAEKLEEEAESIRIILNTDAARTSKGVLTAPAVGVGTAATRARGRVLSALAVGVGTAAVVIVVAGIFTGGVVATVGLTVIAAIAILVAVSLAGVRSPHGNVVLIEDIMYTNMFISSAESFRGISRSFQYLSDHAIAMPYLGKEMIDSLENVLYYLEQEESSILLRAIVDEGRIAYRVTRQKRRHVYYLKNSLNIKHASESVYLSRKNQ